MRMVIDMNSKDEAEHEDGYEEDDLQLEEARTESVRLATIPRLWS